MAAARTYIYGTQATEAGHEYTFMYFGWPRRGSLLRGLILCPSMLERCTPYWSGLQCRLPHIELGGQRCKSSLWLHYNALFVL